MADFNSYHSTSYSLVLMRSLDAREESLALLFNSQFSFSEISKTISGFLLTRISNQMTIYAHSSAPEGVKCSFSKVIRDNDIIEIYHFTSKEDLQNFTNKYYSFSEYWKNQVEQVGKWIKYND